MEYSTAVKLKESWGSKQCDHPGFEKVYFIGAFLINYACTRCGKDFSISQKLTLDEERRIFSSRIEQ